MRCSCSGNKKAHLPRRANSLYRTPSEQTFGLPWESAWRDPTSNPLKPHLSERRPLIPASPKRASNSRKSGCKGVTPGAHSMRLRRVSRNTRTTLSCTTTWGLHLRLRVAWQRLKQPTLPPYGLPLISLRPRPTRPGFSPLGENICRRSLYFKPPPRHWVARPSCGLAWRFRCRPSDASRKQLPHLSARSIFVPGTRN